MYTFYVYASLYSSLSVCLSLSLSLSLSYITEALTLRNKKCELYVLQFLPSSRLRSINILFVSFFKRRWEKIVQRRKEIRRRIIRLVWFGIMAYHPSHLKFPADAATGLWHNYNSLDCLILVENGRLLIVVSLSLLDSSNIFEVFQVINLPIPYPHRKQGSGTVAKYKLGSENIIIDLTREKIMLLTPTEAEKCKYDLFMTWISNRLIYTFSNRIV